MLQELIAPYTDPLPKFARHRLCEATAHAPLFKKGGIRNPHPVQHCRTDRDLMHSTTAVNSLPLIAVNLQQPFSHSLDRVPAQPFGSGVLAPVPRRYSRDTYHAVAMGNTSAQGVSGADIASGRPRGVRRFFRRGDGGERGTEARERRGSRHPSMQADELLRLREVLRASFRDDPECTACAEEKNPKLDCYHSCSTKHTLQRCDAHRHALLPQLGHPYVATLEDHFGVGCVYGADLAGIQRGLGVAPGEWATPAQLAKDMKREKERLVFNGELVAVGSDGILISEDIHPIISGGRQHVQRVLDNEFTRVEFIRCQIPDT